MVLVGPTATGKSSLALALAERLNGAILSADSRLFYRGLDIGTDKPSPAERARIPHAFIDICAPDETLTLGDYQARAYAQIDRWHRAGRLPLLVGGTGQYVRAVIEGWGIPRVAPRPALRAALEALGGPELVRWLARLDPVAADRIDGRNQRRVVRALEVALVSGRPISTLQKKRPPPYEILQLGLTCPRDGLYARIDARVDRMMAAGLLAEVQALRAAGYGPTLPALSGLGYRQLNAYLDGAGSLEEAVARIKFETHRFARQQHNWFRPDDPAIRWFEVDTPDLVERVEAVVRGWLEAEDD